ncbi:hypothetical protein MNV84_00157 [Leishmania braziliensis]|nr:hypothetical protein MNV84_00157 [Leishmania braziliensis]
MNNSAVELQRARRRYKVLLREREALASRGTSDPVVEDEIHKLEANHTGLRPPSSSPLPDHSVAASVPVATSASSEELAKPSSYVARSVSPSTKLHLKTLTLQPRVSKDKLCVGTLVAEQQTHVTPSRVDEQPLAMLSGRLVLFFLRLFNESHQKSFLGCWNCVAIVALSVAVAVLHCTVLDPSSTVGTLITPSLLCYLVHANNLAVLYTQRRQQLSLPMFIVYVCFDAVPSLALDLVVYNLSLTLMGFYGVRPVSFVR